MRIIGRYSRFLDSLEVIPENSLVALEISAATIDTYDRSPLDEDSDCSIRLTVEGSKFGFRVGCPSFDENLPRKIAEEIVETLYDKGHVDLRKYYNVKLYNGHEKRVLIDSDMEY